ncbi:hypothetical protein A6R68_15685, partial [Neotoma lepida]
SPLGPGHFRVIGPVHTQVHSGPRSLPSRTPDARPGHLRAQMAHFSKERCRAQARLEQQAPFQAEVLSNRMQQAEN